MHPRFPTSQLCLFGSQDRFALECELFPPEIYNQHPAPFGILYVWASGIRLGHENEDCDLSVPAGTLLTQWRRRGTLRDPALNGKPTREAFGKFWQERYSEASTAHTLGEYLRWARIEVCPLGEQAHDGWIAIPLEEQDCDRFLWIGDDRPTIHEVVLRSGEFHDVTAQFLDWLEARSPWFHRHRQSFPDRLADGE